jgi:redox-sensitive bicupin YhaK (pirin superfamily)
MPAMSDGKLLGFQLWVNMPAKLKKNKPEYLYIKSNELGVHKDNEKTVKVIAGKYEKVEGPEKNHNVDPIYFHIVLSKGKEFACEVPEGHNSFIYLLKGKLKIGEKDHSKTGNSNLILLERGNKLIAKAIEKTEFLFIAGKPIGEPIARGGPFVMNTKAEILEAVQDYNNGTFAKY